jgi:undecaprenyl-diphosphatase
MDKLIDPLLEMQPLTIYLLIGAFCWTEAAFFLGFITPGELAVVTGGILSSRQVVRYDVLLIVVTSATLLGNATGFLIGQRYGNRALAWPPVQRYLGIAIGKAREFMRLRGEWAIILGRVSTPTRVMTPFLGGMVGMSYRRFVVFDVFASLLWAVCFLSLGYLLGESWTLIREISGAAAILVLGLFIAALAIRWSAVRIIRHQLRFRAAIRLTLRATGTRGLARALRPGFQWFSRRFDPRVARGLSLSICFLVLIAAVACIGLVISQTQSLWGLARFDYPVLDWMVATRTDQAVEVARNALWFFQWPGILALALPIAVVTVWLAGSLAALRIGAGVIGAVAGATLLDRFVLEGHVANAEFPSISVAAAAALAVHAVALTMRLRDWSGAVACAGFALFGVLTIALAVLVAGWSAPSGIALGIGIGLSWAVLLELPWSVSQTVNPTPETASDEGHQQSGLRESSTSTEPVRPMP